MKKKINKKQEAAICKNLQRVSFALSGVVLFLAFFNVMLLTSGGFDDVNSIEVLCLPVLSLIALGTAMTNVSRFKSKGSELVCAIVCLAVACLVAFGYFVHPMLIEALA